MVALPRDLGSLRHDCATAVARSHNTMAIAPFHRPSTCCSSHAYVITVRLAPVDSSNRRRISLITPRAALFESLPLTSYDPSPSFLPDLVIRLRHLLLRNFSYRNDVDSPMVAIQSKGMDHLIHIWLWLVLTDSKGELDHISPYGHGHPESALYRHPPSPFGYTSQALAGSFSPIEPFPHYTSHGTSTQASRGSSPDRSLPSQWANAAYSASTLSMPVSCDECSQEFTGAWRRGNLKRHIREKHGGPYTCIVEGCFHVFQRADAGLKHARRKHPELNLPLVERRRGTEHDTYPSLHVAAYDSQDSTRSVGEWLQAEHGYMGNHTSTVQHEVDPSAGVEQLPRAAKCVFRTLHTKLRPSDYSRICDAFFSRWESIVQQLKDDQ
jgi:hypothetical protein